MSDAAGWYAQDDGRERYWDGERWTDAFRPPTAVDQPQAVEPASTPPPESAKKPGSGVGCLSWVIGVPVVLGILFGANSCGGDDDSSGNPYAVQITCQGLVKNNLKNPTTAEFSEKSQTEFSAAGMVTAENALGGKQTFRYSCSASGDTVKLDALEER